MAAEIGTIETRLMTVAEVAKWLNVSEQFVYAHTTGRCRVKLPHIKLAGSVRFRREAIEAFIGELERKAKA